MILLDEQRTTTRCEADKMNDLFKLRLILTAMLCVAFGMWIGVTMEKRNHENIKQYQVQK